ncbi:similar to Saccharomyces cerevisiae YPL228W CET1 Beta (RNA 5'- triphosphatase) subunit of the mRNA capping enzyme [Maudiozyma barnettii]|uniref:mRNA-capping enzyme subunit beta n=1 Tax=Maudiozyma barnettii TaxID=61262 RepID=A0A8H2VH91_9SACH|nr:similar to Saccharomyces cerevisiae YPL228W CET1 Beta (RNA 5'- triphosphatase) subunit of the mRNA capping enzyme [Kazachstania barnettii]CAB4255370.1 similar to Saccharomyces cerevisiae YPL228W CET1 Beta (RNA 5'- triphosphatase) subunit of the mRNA capping enzyme [Kazachstania barnettii]CAD1783776.1 similar to Saccharomyces cerevisiae YPL228W CET1 Beta (RNA 5'- triphosphatase) subunit of the mRNA capping enzyme [Kazachstania barnettii]
MTKRALSLDDLVNHDEGDKIKLQKMSENINNTTNNSVENAQPVRKTSIGIADINNAEDTDPITGTSEPSRRDEKFNMGQNRNILNDDSTNVTIHPTDTEPVRTSSVPSTSSVEVPQPIEKPSVTQHDDETDTDDELGGTGEINFDSGMTFDYDKQDNNSPQKPQTTRVTKVKKQEDTDKKKQEDIQKNKKEDNEEKEPKSNESADSTTVNEKEEQENSILKKKNKKPVKEQKTKEQQESMSNIFEEKSSNISKRNNIKKDLEVLNEISSVSKPNKYKNVPTWARKWKPTISALQSIDASDFKIDSSFLNIIPDDDLTKSVQDWVYATVYSIEPELRHFIELEMKFGLIVEAKSPERVSPPIASQAVYTDLDAHLTPNVDEVLFKELNKYIRGVSEMNENSGKFSIIESQTKDSVYRVGLSTQRPRFLRMSRDIQTGRVGQFIEKRHISQILLLSPKDSYDVKISLNLELPVPENEPPEKYQNQTPVSERSKDRVSYIHNDSCTRVDVTTVQNHNQGVKGRHTETTYEIELEINTPALLNAFDKINDDSKEYAAVIRTFLNNGTIIRRKLTSLSYDIFEGNKK